MINAMQNSEWSSLLVQIVFPWICHNVILSFHNGIYPAALLVAQVIIVYLVTYTIHGRRLVGAYPNKHRLLLYECTVGIDYRLSKRKSQIAKDDQGVVLQMKFTAVLLTILLGVLVLIFVIPSSERACKTYDSSAKREVSI